MRQLEYFLRVQGAKGARGYALRVVILVINILFLASICLFGNSGFDFSLEPSSPWPLEPSPYTTAAAAVATTVSTFILNS